MRDPETVVSWLVPTTLFRHNWIGRLLEFLWDDFPAPLSELIILGTQDADFVRQAQRIGYRVASSVAATNPHIMAKWPQVRFIERAEEVEGFNVAHSRRILEEAAAGDVIIHLDADVAIIGGRNFSRYAVAKLMQSRLGLLSFPSLNNGYHHKPEPNLPVMPDPRPGIGQDILLAASANGMAVAMLRAIANAMGGQNRAHQRWGVYSAFCTKLAQAGLLSGYAMPGGHWLATSDGESSISLTDSSRNPNSKHEKQVGVAMLRDFYNLELGPPRHPFLQGYHERYGVDDSLRSQEVATEAMRRAETFARHQSLPLGMEVYPFRPWECLHHPKTPDLLTTAYARAEAYFAPLEERLRRLGLHDLLPSGARDGSGRY